MINNGCVEYATEKQSFLMNMHGTEPKMMQIKLGLFRLKELTRKSIIGDRASFTRIRDRTVCRLVVAGRGFSFSFLQLHKRVIGFNAKFASLVICLNVLHDKNDTGGPCVTTFLRLTLLK